MPPLNMSALPPLTNRWPMTLPTSTTELEQMRHNAMAMRSQPPPPPSRLQQQSTQLAMRPPQSGHVPSTPRIKYCKGVQTDSTTASIGPRKVPPSLQYCRLCFQKQDLEPIFTGDQTLIEPDLIDKIFGCTEIMVSMGLFWVVGDSMVNLDNMFFDILREQTRGKFQNGCDWVLTGNNSAIDFFSINVSEAYILCYCSHQKNNRA